MIYDQLFTKIFFCFQSSQNIHVKLTFQNVILVWRAHLMARAHLVTGVTQREHLVSGIVISAAT